MTDTNYAGTDADTLLVRSRAGDEPPSESVIRAVSEATGTDPLRMPRLGDVVDPDALDALFLGGDGDGGTPPGTVTFRFNGCGVTVHADGPTVVSRPTEARP